MESLEEDRYAVSSLNLHRVVNCFIAEGNPDEEKIGAFGVGRFICSSVILPNLTICRLL